METKNIIIISAISLFLIILIIVIIKKKPKKINVNQKFIDELTKLLGDKKNILSVKTEVSRLIIELDDLEIVDLEAINKLSSGGVLVVGNSIKVLFKINSKEIEKKLK